MQGENQRKGFNSFILVLLLCRDQVSPSGGYLGSLPKTKQNETENK